MASDDVHPHRGGRYTDSKGNKIVVKSLCKSKWAGEVVDTVVFENERGEQTAMEISEWRKRYAPEPRTLWKHKENGELYRVIVVANEHAARDGWVPTVVYERCEDQTVWARPVSEWEGRYVRA